MREFRFTEKWKPSILRGYFTGANVFELSRGHGVSITTLHKHRCRIFFPLPPEYVQAFKQRTREKPRGAARKIAYPTRTAGECGTPVNPEHVAAMKPYIHGTGGIIEDYRDGTRTHNM